MLLKSISLLSSSSTSPTTALHPDRALTSVADAKNYCSGMP